MRRTVLTLLAAAALSGVAPTTASASHACAEGFEILCTRVCISKFDICIWH